MGRAAGLATAAVAAKMTAAARTSQANGGATSCSTAHGRGYLGPGIHLRFEIRDSVGCDELPPGHVQHFKDRHSEEKQIRFDATSSGLAASNILKIGRS